MLEAAINSNDKKATYEMNYYYILCTFLLVTFLTT